MNQTVSSAPPVAGIVLAAGAGQRFGSPKQLAPFAGRPLLEHALLAASAAQLKPLVVVLGFESERILERVDLHSAEPVICQRWADGQAASLIAGIEAIGEADAAAVTLGDQPLISPDAIDAVVAARSAAAAVVRASYGGALGHPVVLERAALDRALDLSGDEGARRLFADLEVRTVACDGLGSPVDIDTPEGLVRLESETKV